MPRQSTQSTWLTIDYRKNGCFEPLKYVKNYQNNLAATQEPPLHELYTSITVCKTVSSLQVSAIITAEGPLCVYSYQRPTKVNTASMQERTKTSCFILLTAKIAEIFNSSSRLRNIIGKRIDRCCPPALPIFNVSSYMCNYTKAIGNAIKYLRLHKE